MNNINKEIIIKLNISNINDKKIDQYLQRVKSQFQDDEKTKVTVIPILYGESNIGIIIYKMAGKDIVSEVYNMII